LTHSIDSIRPLMEAALRGLKMKDLKKRAKVLGVTADEFDDAEDADDVKSAVVELALAKLRELKALKRTDLKARCTELGVDGGDIDDCLDEDDPQEAMVLLLLKAAETAGGGATPRKPPQDASPALSLVAAEEGVPPGARSPTPEMTVMKVVVEIKEQLGLEGSINPAATATAGREALGMAAAPAGLKLKDNLSEICLELGIATGWTTVRLLKRAL
jgi:hypothetical protein